MACIKCGSSQHPLPYQVGPDAPVVVAYGPFDGFGVVPTDKVEQYFALIDGEGE